MNLIASIVLLISIFGGLNTSGIIADGQGKRLLALLDSYSVRETHSSFFKSLKDRGFQITYKAADDADLALTKYNEYVFDHLVLFCPNVVGWFKFSNILFDVFNCNKKISFYFKNSAVISQQNQSLTLLMQVVMFCWQPIPN
jgi:hypothetical protein